MLARLNRRILIIAMFFNVVSQKGRGMVRTTYQSLERLLFEGI